MRSCILLLLLCVLQLNANQSIAINTLTANGVTAGEAASLTDALKSAIGTFVPSSRWTMMVMHLHMQ
jgi:hypothetical protein